MSKHNKKLPLAIAAPVALAAYEIAKTGKGNSAAAVARITGYDPSNGQFAFGNMASTYVPILAGVIVHKAASRFGVNRMLPSWLPVNI